MRWCTSRWPSISEQTSFLATGIAVLTSIWSVLGSNPRAASIFKRSVHDYGHYSSGQYSASVRRSLRAGYLTSAFKYLRLFWRSYRLWSAWTRSTWCPRSFSKTRAPAGKDSYSSRLTSAGADSFRNITWRIYSLVDDRLQYGRTLELHLATNWPYHQDWLH